MSKKRIAVLVSGGGTNLQAILDAQKSGIITAGALDRRAGTYECRKCGCRFVPTSGAYIMGIHGLTWRHLKCPQCGKRTLCRRRLTH